MNIPSHFKRLVIGTAALCVAALCVLVLLSHPLIFFALMALLFIPVAIAFLYIPVAIGACVLEPNHPIRFIFLIMGFIYLIIECAVIVIICHETTQPYSTCGPFDFDTIIYQPEFTAIWMIIMGCLIGLGLFTTRVWPGIQGLLCSTTAIVLILIMLNHHKYLTIEPSEVDSLGHPPDIITFYLYSIPVIVLLAIGYLRLRRWIATIKT